MANVTTDGTQQVAEWANDDWAFPRRAHPSSVATLPNGDYVVAWEDLSDTGVWNAYARVFQADGTPVTGEIRVNSITTAQDADPPKSSPTGFDPTVAADANGNFVVVFKGSGTPDDAGVYARQFDSAGTALGSEFLVNSTTQHIQEDPAVAMAPDGRFVVTWTTWQKQGRSVQRDIAAQRFDSSGQAVGPEFQVNNNDKDPQLQPTVAMDDAGNFVVGWLDVEPFIPWGDVVLQRYDAAGNTNGDPLTVNTDGRGRHGKLDFDSSGNFVVAWSDETRGLFGKQFDSGGVALGSQFQIDDEAPRTGDGHLSVTVADDGSFVVTWESNDGTDADPSTGIYGREYGPDSTPDSDGTFLVNSVLSGAQRNPSVAITPDGSRFVTVWSGNGSGDDQGVFFRRYTVEPNPGITVTPTSGLVTSEDLTSDAFTIVLDTQPTDNVTIGISSDDASEGTPNVSSLIFTPTNWDTPQTVTVTGADDAEADGDVAYTIVTAAATSTDTAYNGINPADVQVTNLDNETPAELTVAAISPDSMAAGSTVRVTITGSGFQAGASVTFENFSGPDPAASNVIVVDSNTITADVTAGSNGPKRDRVGDVRVTNPDSSTDSCENCFTVTVSTGASATSAAMESTAASFDASTSNDTAGDDTDLVSVAAPLPSAGTSLSSFAASESVSTNTDEAAAIDDAISDFDAGPLREALLEDLAVALVG